MIELTNAGWCWWTYPRTVVCGGRTYLGVIRDDGNYGFDLIGSDGSVRRIITAGSAKDRVPGDDHDNTAIVAVPGKPLLMFATKHNGDRFIYRYSFGWNGDAEPVQGWINTPVTFGYGSAAGHTNNFVQALAVPSANTIHLFSTVDNRYQGYMRSEDWGGSVTAQPGSPTPTFWIDFGQLYQGGTLASFGFCYYTQLASDPTKVRAFFGCGFEPGQRSVHYCEIDLTTGSITKSDGTVLGNLRTGANLPLPCQPGNTPFETVFTPNATGSIQFATDVRGDTTQPEGLFCIFDSANPDTASVQYWAQRQADNSWLVEPVTNAGPRFSTSPSTGYHSNAQFMPDGSVILGRATGDGSFTNGTYYGTWNLEKWTRQGPNNWTSVVLQTDPRYPLVRAFPVAPGGAYSYAYTKGYLYTQYDNWSNSIVVV